MTKISVRFLLLSCAVAVTFIAPVAQAQTSQSITMQTTTVSPGETVNAVNSANAAAAYTGNQGLAQQAAQPGQAMLPNGMQMGPFQPAEPPPTLRYNKKEAEGAFYGVELPQRLFNNVPSDW